MDIKYKITAYSPSLTQEIREIELDGTIIMDEQLANRRAASFAQQLNNQQHMQARDWQGRVGHI
jgi:hypothetical protein